MKILLVIGLIFLIGIVSAQQEVILVKYNTCVDLRQTCTNCTYSKISTLVSPSQKTVLSAVDMTTTDNVHYNYTYCDMTELGDYVLDGYSNVDLVDTSWAYTVRVTPSGYDASSSNIALFIIAIVIVYGIAGFGLVQRNVTITIIGGLAMLVLGIYLFNNGIIIYRDDITRTISYITIGIGAILGIWGSYEWYQEM